MIGRVWPGSRDDGQAAPMLVVMVVLAMGLVLVAVEVGRLLDEGARARIAADAAALAGAAEGRDRAEALAAANGGSLIAYIEEIPNGDAGRVVVTASVEVGRASRTARAEGVTEWVDR